MSVGTWIELRNPDCDAIMSLFEQDAANALLEKYIAIAIIKWALVFVWLSVASLTRRTEITDEQRIESCMKQCANV